LYNDPESCADSTIVTGRASHARQVKWYVPDKVGHSGPPGWGLYRVLIASHKKELLISFKIKYSAVVPQGSLPMCM